MYDGRRCERCNATGRDVPAVCCNEESGEYLCADCGERVAGELYEIANQMRLDITTARARKSVAAFPRMSVVLGPNGPEVRI